MTIYDFIFSLMGICTFSLEPVSGSEWVGTSRKQGQGEIGRAWNRLFRLMRVYLNSGYMLLILNYSDLLDSRARTTTSTR